MSEATMSKPHQKEVDEVLAFVEQLKPLFAGKPPEVQGGALGNLVAMFLAGHAPALRKPILGAHLGLVRGLIPAYEMEIFGKAGHPGKLKR
jgi:hypothetical protein